MGSPVGGVGSYDLGGHGDGAVSSSDSGGSVDVGSRGRGGEGNDSKRLHFDGCLEAWEKKSECRFEKSVNRC